MSLFRQLVHFPLLRRCVVMKTSVLHKLGGGQAGNCRPRLPSGYWGGPAADTRLLHAALAAATLSDIPGAVQRRIVVCCGQLGRPSSCRAAGDCRPRPPR